MRRKSLHLLSEDALSYTPEPIDTSNVTLTAEHLKLTELLAKNTHDLWAQQRLSQGWKYGTQRDDTRKEHPGLIPYEKLPESEKQYDRITALGVLKTVLALGYRLEGDGIALPNSVSNDDRELTLIIQSLKDTSELNLNSLLALERETIKLQPRTPDIYRVLGDSILQLGEPLIAYDAIAQGLKRWSNDLRLQQLLALALARSGATHRANSLLLQLLQSDPRDEETISLLARTHKDLWKQATSTEEKHRQLRLAAERYQQAYQLRGNYYPGINAATMAMLLGEEDRAKAIADQVRQQCLQQLKPPDERHCDQYWLLATLGEAALILRERSEAEDWYSQAVQVGQGRIGDISSSRCNAKLLVQYLHGDIGWIDQWFQIPRVVVFSGHTIDPPDRATPRFPAQMEALVTRAICDRLVRFDASLGYASPACGSDILFLEAILELKGEAHIVLPYEREQFLKDAVDIIPGGNWMMRFERVLQRATEVIVASKRKPLENSVLSEYTNRLLHGLAKMRAEQLDTELLPLAVWNGQPRESIGGTSSAIAHWQQWGDRVEVIDLETLRQSLVVNLQETPKAEEGLTTLVTQAEETPPQQRQIMGLLFADVVHYSLLTEDQISPFMQHFLGAVAGLLERLDDAPLMKNTWGDAVYFVFSDVRQAGNFALELCDLVQQTDWLTKGLPNDLNLRIALHAGPVYRQVNPITGYIEYIGTHVSHTARIEPITPPGKVYASQAFAAIAASEGVSEFTCDYVGQTPWAKGYGTFPTYHVRRRQV
jgi:class 3 adenylate cyclase